ncbi:hypothetical protein DCAR_0313742 [Daucus carota subsp. sativus]|uniref:DC1 domain-containing protein n=1 Tax=Daucus carota subsp. sativus TaxID=79200 RepID=A0AAF0WSB2_DAUCS|nr:hypothetical protein DCAR_0313742 [Daucus carota subsp. sativus]
MEFVNHSHPLILNENFHGGEEDACYLCRERLRSTPLYSVYRCSSRDNTSGLADDAVNCVKLFVHKICAELPLKITDYFKHPQHPITLVRKIDLSRKHCSICFWALSHTIVYSCKSCDLTVCLRCATSPLIYHPSHNQHALALVQRQASFCCDACGMEASSWSSCKCNTCPFWIHTSCAILSSFKKFQFHIHPLLLAYSFPQQYLNFRQKCKICRCLIQPTRWFYYCAGCRFFVHLNCTDTALEMTMRSPESDDDMVYLPMSSESSVQSWRRLLISRVTSSHEEDKDVINHWSHDQHPLFLRKKFSTPPCTKAPAVNLNNADDDTIILCDGCTNAIDSSNTSYYECRLCNYFLHRCCAELPKQLQSPHLFYRRLLYDLSSNYLFRCGVCFLLKSGMRMSIRHYQLDIGCASLPKYIKHEAHSHPLTQVLGLSFSRCQACGLSYEEELNFDCTFCHRFKLCGTCALRPRKLEHRWDPHPLTLITNPENIIEDHPQDYNCEHCSDDIDTNYWFYHCGLCDLSCHMSCIKKFYRYSNIKFNTSGIKIEQRLHEHGLTLVLIKRKRRCGCCDCDFENAPMLQCTPCSFVICIFCVNPGLKLRYGSSL